MGQNAAALRFGPEQAAPASPVRNARPSWAGRLLLLPFHALAVFSASKAFNTNPVIGSRTLNRRGLHIGRRMLAARLGAMRRRSLAGLLSDEDRAAFERDGFIVKRDFLDPATFQAFRNEIMALDVPARESVNGDTLTRLIALDGPTLDRLPVARAVLQGSAYRGLINYVGSFRRRPSLYVQSVFSQFAPGGAQDVQSFFHTDTFHPTVKSWFFLQDVDDDAAPFAYVPGSHRANRRKLAWERRVSCTARHAGDRLTAEGSFRISEAEIRRLGYPDARKLPVAANTLVVADTSGIHRRSTTDRSTVRVSIWAYSRSNPFLPWAGGDPLALPFIGRHGQRLYWAVSDLFKNPGKGQPVWRWVGRRTPLMPPARDR
ncbi:phytanoyl-CoA dioxygenase family protein [Nguyenibacter sp. L1]|uniref:phytanoyl-CoA dioxygenase family protein n=1 Tax=Nguyenibacter sp. L1 TaxID=3049350 RepID=UPI002B46C014|nr:phytanoyl-CoA dioxygenase family protein [Nguyenibacter sp. L1]WRH89351.1 phytanoyl-CoA dioxygenase family protein [Nguyenibacter sp. L1]